ncbi:multidrug effflux MFS transporter [Parablastomonas sp. CN1-191]|uniref:multidrug effflux MFS transporter n=1 Tax=Parablastomonas sp. CN1-191 TaxID=3400908 RepID=UPI003BF8C8AD
MSATTAPRSPQFKLGEGEFVFMMAMSMALQALAIDAMLPALGAIASDLGVADPNRRQLIVGAFLVAAGVSSLVPGSLADRFGRRPVLFGGLFFYALFAIGCAMAKSFDQLLTMRVLQAVGSSALTVLPAAIVRDRFVGDRMARAMSTVAVVFMIVPMLAPSFGQFVMLFAGWRWIFGGMAVMAAVLFAWAWLRLPETLHPDFRQAIEPGRIARNMVLSARNRASIGYVIGSSMVMAGLFGYINSAQQLVAEHFGAGHWFPLLFAISAGSMALANFTNSRIVERFGARRVSHAALLTFIAISSVQVWQAARGGETLLQFMPLMTLNMMLVGFIGANFGSIAMQPFAEIAGAAASFQAFTRMVIGAVLGALIGQAFDGTALPLALALLSGGIVSLILVLYSERGKLFRRLNQRGTTRDPGMPSAH